MEVSFVTSAPDLRERPERVLPEFAFLGRSNCGKSSLINLFLGRARMAKISSKPGKTRLLNYFLVDDRFYVVDLPGYGFAKVSKQQREQWRGLFQRYLASQDRPMALFQLLDIRRDPSPEDLEISAWMIESGHPYAVAVTKSDKVGLNSRSARYQAIADAMQAPADTPFFTTSARDRTGRDEMLGWVEALLEANSDDA